MSEKNNNSFESTVSSLFQGMDHFISSKTVVGDAITVGDTIILPLVDVTIRLVNVKNQDAVTKILDMVPDFVNKFTSGGSKKGSDPEVERAVDEILNQ